ncbi:MAG: hypothetical protein PVH68_08050 [Armatimonadota bacterium]|jgi:putative protease
MAPEQEAVEGRLVGTITHFFGNISVGIIELTDTVRVGDTIQIKGATTDFTQSIASMQVEHEAVEEAAAGQTIGIKVDERVREGDEVFIV